MFNASRHRPTLDDQLLDAHGYHEIFEALRRRAAERPSLLVQRRPGTIGLRWVLAHEARLTETILEALVSPGFQLGNHRRVTIFAGKKRDIYVAEWPDRIVLMRMGRLLSERMESTLSDRVYSFRKGRSHWDALQGLRTFLRERSSGEPIHVLRRDVTKFGDSIDPERALAQAHQSLGIAPGSLFGRVLALGLHIRFEVDGAETSLETGIPSGSPLVPPLENLYLEPLDRQLAALPDTYYARYGDDLLVATPSAAVAEDARRIIRDVIAERGLRISPSKALDVTVTDANQGFEWLGFRVGRDGRLGPKRARWREARRQVCAELDRFVGTVFRAELDEAQRVAVLREGLAQILTPAGSPWLASMVFEQDDLRSLRELDAQLVKHLADTLGKALGGGRQRGWRLFRKLGYRSLIHQRHQRWA